MFHFVQEKCILNKLKYINYQQHRFHSPASSNGRNARHAIWLVKVWPIYLRLDFAHGFLFFDTSRGPAAQWG